KLLIIHADDIGVAHSVNAASIAAFEKKGISSGSIMVPCPWFPEIAEYAKTHPHLDLGIHITLTAEWKNYKWGGVLSANEIPSLLNKEGFFYATVEEFAKNAKPSEVELEIRAQIDRAIAFGIQPTHLDSHMGTLFASPEFFRILQKIGKEYKMPVLLPINMIRQMAPGLEPLIEPGQVTLTQLFSLWTNLSPDKWNQAYYQFIQQLSPGLNEILVHLAYDNEEMQAIAIDHPDFGSQWRQRDYNFVVSEELKALLKKTNTYLVTWRDVQKILKP
ncbi:MAG: polysaccharide deacetylase family protein, partial [Flavitalea sp.]